MTFDPRLADEQHRTRQYGTSVTVGEPHSDADIVAIDIMSAALDEFARRTSKPPPD